MSATAITGPDIDWQGPDDVELQSWFAQDPPAYDMGFIAQALQHAISVCLVSVPLSGETGTGVLIGDRLALTNYHVVEAVLAGGLKVADAAMIELTFGKYGEGQPTISVTLDDAEPILDWSPTGELDFALLHLSKSIDDSTVKRAARLSISTPRPKDPLSLLQHPKGGNMQLAPSMNAVAHVDDATGLIQYFANTSPGSSGAPCFDDQWEVVAIHHAERSRPIGKIREGILISPIRDRISKYLN
jgi:endonuclease G, mitochondrial